MRLKLKSAVLLTALVVWGVFAAGCATTVAIEKQYPERWEKTYVGMTVEEFKNVWPQANYGGVGENGGEIYIISAHKLYSGFSMEYFIFDKENKLEKRRESNIGSVER
jgi:hypothetical protein